MHRLVFILVVLALGSAACGDDGGGGGAESADSTSTTQAPPAVTAAELAEIGPSPVGVTTRELPTGNLVEIWYPAGPDAEGLTHSYSLRDFTPALMRELVPADLDDRVTIAAGRDATVASDGPYPLVLFSHGSAGFRSQSSNLAHHLASWGMVVASADHPSRSFENFVDRPDDTAPASDEVLATRELLSDDDVFGPAIDLDRVGLSGHSAGGGTILTVAEEKGFVGYASLASGAGDDSPLPEIPSLFLAGALDSIAEPSRTRDAFDRAPAPSWYVEFEATGHNAFTDLCTVGDDDDGVMSVFVAAGLDSLLTDDLRRLAEDGCVAPSRPVREVWPGIHQATTGFFRYVFGIDPSPIGLDAPAVAVTAATAK
jgi:dienelactone hydrolase